MNAPDTDKQKYQDAVSYLYGLQQHGIKLGLDNTVRLLSLLGNPQHSFQSVHVAGTNGKGSTSAMIASMLRAAGFRVGLFTSPHLVSFTERIRMDGGEIGEGEVVALAHEIREIIEANQDDHPFQPTFFEFVTAMAFRYFAQEKIEWAVVETGMGGRLDATNVLVPRATVITKIGYDHREFLGRTLGEISAEKAGIIKEGIPVVTSSQDPEAQEVITGTAAEKGCELFLSGRDFRADAVRGDRYGVTFTYRGGAVFNDLHVPLCGTHQAENAAVAVKAIEVLMQQEQIPEGAVREGLARTRWQGRLELIQGRDTPYDLLIDGAHNPSAAQALAGALQRYFIPSYRKVILILGIMADKDIEGILKPLLPLASEIILTAPDYERAASPVRLFEIAASLGFPGARVVQTVSAAIETAKRLALQRSLIVITGSFYTIGEAKTLLGQEGILARLRE